MPVPFPHHYKAQLVRTLSSRGRIEAAPRSPITGGPSPEFDGDATAWSAEQLLLSSIGLCMLTTFEAFAVRDGVELLNWKADVGGTVEKTATGPQFTKFTIAVEMEVGDVERAHKTLDEAQRHCLVTKVLNAPVEVIATITPSARRAG